MKVRTRLAQMLLLGIVAGMAGFWVAGAQTALELVKVDQTGWWTKRIGAQPLGAGKFEVASGLQGEESVAALRVLVRGEITKATLVLGEADAPLKDVDPGKLRVCTTTEPWLLADGGAYADAPTADCANAVEMQRVEDVNGTGSWSADVTPLVNGARSEVTLMVMTSVPNPAPLIPTAYFIAMTGRVAAEGIPDVVANTTPDPPPSPVASPAATPRPSAPSASPAPAAAATPTSEAAAPVAAPATDTTQPRRFAVVSTTKPAKPWGKLFVLVPIALLLGALYTASQKILEDRAST